MSIITAELDSIGEIPKGDTTGARSRCASWYGCERQAGRPHGGPSDGPSRPDVPYGITCIAAVCSMKPNKLDINILLSFIG